MVLGDEGVTYSERGEMMQMSEKEKMPTADTVSNLKEKSFEQDSSTILPQENEDFFVGFSAWCAKPPALELRVRTV